MSKYKKGFRCWLIHLWIAGLSFYLMWSRCSHFLRNLASLKDLVWEHTKTLMLKIFFGWRRFSETKRDRPFVVTVWLTLRCPGNTLTSPSSSSKPKSGAEWKLLLWASVAVQRRIIQKTTMACKMEQHVPLTWSWEVKHLPYCLVFFTRWEQRDEM